MLIKYSDCDLIETPNELLFLFLKRWVSTPRNLLWLPFKEDWNSRHSHFPCLKLQSSFGYLLWIFYSNLLFVKPGWKVLGLAFKAEFSVACCWTPLWARYLKEIVVQCWWASEMMTFWYGVDEQYRNISKVFWG